MKNSGQNPPANQSTTDPWPRAIALQSDNAFCKFWSDVLGIVSVGAVGIPGRWDSRRYSSRNSSPSSRTSTHDLDVAILVVELSVASHDYIMERGKVVLDGSADELTYAQGCEEYYPGGAGDQRRFRQDCRI